MTLAQASQGTVSDVFSEINPAKAFTSGELTIAGILTGGGINLINLVFFLVGAFFLGSLLIAASRYIGSEGDPKKITDASHRITNSLLGLVIAFAAFAIVRIVASIFGYGDIVRF